jgi:DNA (cytosine-5)-methyltransferase 1
MPLGWEAAWFSEIEPFPCAVLAERFPNVPNLGDMTKISIQTNGDITYGADAVIPNDGRAIDLIVGGTPCQDASIAGKRAGLVEGERSKLAFTFTRLAYELAAYRGLRWVVWENVPGVFSLNKGWDFAMFLSSIAGRNVEPPKDRWGTFGIVPEGSRGNFGLCWRVLDVQYCRVDGFPRAIPQRRRRCFLVGYLGDWRRAAEVLFEPKSLLGDNPPSRKAGKATATDAERSVGNAECYATQSYSEIRKSNNASTLKAEGGVYGGGSENYVVKWHGCGEHANSLSAQGSEQPKSISS